MRKLLRLYKIETCLFTLQNGENELDAIILCGGSGWRLKPNTWVPKPKLKINDETLIARQVNWLRRNGIDRIILATNNKDLIEDPSVTYSIEKKKLGTGGAVKKAVEKVKEKRFTL